MKTPAPESSEVNNALMRAVLWFLGLFACAVALALLMGGNLGTITLFWPPWRVDVSANLALLLLLAAALLLHAGRLALRWPGLPDSGGARLPARPKPAWPKPGRTVWLAARRKPGKPPPPHWPPLARRIGPCKRRRT